jgi:hypothetical protein
MLLALKSKAFCSSSYMVMLMTKACIVCSCWQNKQS